MRRTTTLTALLLGAALLAPTGAATAAGDTCRGEAATLVGTGSKLGGTEGRDVIVTGTATYVVGYGGDDLICVTGPPASDVIVSVNAGPGNDTVDATAFGGTDGVGVVLGEGADQLFGSPYRDSITTGAERTSGVAVAPDNERDVIDAGNGDDFIITTAGTTPSADVITTGHGDDHLSVDGPMAPDGLLDLGDGTDSLYATISTPGALAVDAATGTSALNGADWMRWTGVEDLGLLLRNEIALTYAGTASDESLFVSGAVSVDAALGGGDDELGLYSTFGQSDIDTGPGRDTVTLIGTSAVKADLSKDTLIWGGKTGDLIGVENMSAFGSSVRLVGDGKRNVLAAGTCSTRMKGGGGRDDLSRAPLPEDAPEARCSNSKKTGIFDGGAGNDTLDGSFYDDVLRGGPGSDRIMGRQGRDIAVGGPGRDRCRTEVRKSCESR